MFDTYVINLKQDINRYKKLKEDLKKLNIHLERFDAIYGKEIKNIEKYNKYIENECKYICPKSVIGIGLSHTMLLEKIYKNYIKNGGNNYSLILEDDVEPLLKNKNIINKIIKESPKDSDIILLYCQGYCNYNKREKKYIKKKYFIGSLAAYLIKKSSIPKLLKKKIYFHIDMQFFMNDKVNTYVYNDKLFKIKYNEHSYTSKKLNNKILSIIDKYLKIDNLKFSDLLKYKILNIPFLNIELSSLEILYILILILILIIYKNIKR